ncbi:MAG: aspartyl protease family protein [Bacteroidales bacterium]|nr:aspartyl protease family protein [Candidatus Latescibacterota bacterium]
MVTFSRSTRLACAAITLLVITSLMVAGALAQTNQPPAVPRFDSGKIATATEVEFFGHIIYIPMMVNGTGPYSFVLDTGAGRFSAIDYSVAEALGLEQTLLMKGGGAGEDIVEINNVDSVSFASIGISFDPRSAISIPLHRMDPHWGKRKDGLIGGDLLSALITVVDYEAGTLVFHDPATYEYNGPGERVPIELFNNYIFIRAEVLLHGPGDPIEAFFMVDTGVRLSLFNSPYSREHSLPAQSPSTITGVTGFGLGGLSQGVIGRVHGIRIGSTLIENPVVNFSTDTTGGLAATDFSGIIGADILSRFTLILDYSRSEIILEKNDRFAAPFENDMCGIRFVMDGERFDIFRAFSIFDGSPAAEAGILEGDVLTAVDGREASSFTIETLMEYLSREGAVVRLTIKRGSETKEFAITLRRMV